MSNFIIILSSFSFYGPDIFSNIITVTIVFIGLFVLVRTFESLFGVNISPKVSGTLGLKSGATGTKISVKAGYDIKIKGEAKKEIINANITTFAIQPPNFRGLVPIPRILVKEGEYVKAGQPIFVDKKMTNVMFVSPVSGTVHSICRGEKRAIDEVKITTDNKVEHVDLDVKELNSYSTDELRAFLQSAGAWGFFKQRPYNIIPGEDDKPRDIFVSTFKTGPLAADQSFIIKGKEKEFQKGLDVLNKLTEGKVYLGLDGRSGQNVSEAFSGAEGVEKTYFSGKHPVGNVGLQINKTKPINLGDKVWTLGVQDVVSIGSIFTKGYLDTERIIAIAGHEIDNPIYVKTYLGALIGELLEGQNVKKNARIISGDVLTGRRKINAYFLNYHDDLVSVIKEGNYFDFFGWLKRGKTAPTISETYLNRLFGSSKEYEVDTNTHGDRRAFVVTDEYEKVMGMDIYLQQLMKAIIVNDIELMEGLGLLELVEEDVALAEFGCTSKQPLQTILRQGLMNHQNG